MSDNDLGWDIMHIEYRVTAGALEPGSEVRLTDTATFRNGQTVDTDSTGTFVGEYESMGEAHYWFSGLKWILQDSRFGESRDGGIPARYFSPGGAATDSDAEWRSQQAQRAADIAYLEAAADADEDSQWIVIAAARALWRSAPHLADDYTYQWFVQRAHDVATAIAEERA
jgi:hypothetical protein